MIRRFVLLLALLLFPVVAQAQTVVSQVHNAPGWIHGHTYHTGDRVNNGPGWNEGTGKWVPYSLLRAYQVISGTCTSAVSGGPTETTADITDNTCHWKYLSDTDYVTLTGWGNDVPLWTAQPYGYMETVAAPDANGILTRYINTNNNGCGYPGPQPAVTPRACGYNVPGNCNSTVAPPNAPASDNCTWAAINPILYTSGRSYIPQQRRLANNWAVELRVQPYEADLWNDREYVMGQNGEGTGQNILYNHINSDNHNVAIAQVGNPCGSLQADWGGPQLKCPYRITAAPGESFVDTLAANPNLPFTRNPAYGVSIVGQLGLADWWVNPTRLQMYNPTGPVVGGFGRDGDFDLFSNDIIEFGTPGVSSSVPWSLGTGDFIANSLVIAHGPGSFGSMSVYGGGIVHSTLVNPEGTGAACNITKWNWVYVQGVNITNSICAGFAHTNGAFANNDPNGIQFISYNSDPANASFAPHAYTTSPNENAGGVNPFVFSAPTNPWDNTQSFNEFPVNGMTYAVSPNGLFMGPNDYRIPATSPLHGAGANYGPVNFNGISPGIPTAYINYDATDILGTPRPATGQNIGAWQTPGAPPTTFTVSVSAPSNGTVTSSPSGITCGGTCSGTFNIGTTVTLTATPSGGFTFTGWGGNCISFGTSPCTLNTNSSATATFAPITSQFNNRSARFTARQVPPPGPPPTGILQMPTGIAGFKTVDVGVGAQTIEVYIGPTCNNPRPVFYIVASDGVTDVQVTSNTTNPMRVTSDPPDCNNTYVQGFVFHGNWGINISQIKVREVTSGSMFQAVIGTNYGPGGAFTAVAVDTLGRGVKAPVSPYTQGEPYGQIYYYFGPSTDPEGHIVPSKGYANVFSGNKSEMLFEPCNKLVPYIQCPPVYDRTEDTISSIKLDSVTQSPTTLSSLAANLTGTHTIELPSGTFAAATRLISNHTLRGQGIDVTTLDNHGIQPYAFKAGLDLEAGGVTIADMTIKNNIIGSNAGGIFLTNSGTILDHVKLTWDEDGIRGSPSIGDPNSDIPNPFILQNSIITDNGNDGFLQHEIYINGGVCMSNNNQITQGPRSDHAHKWRCYWGAINGGTIVGCGDPFAEVCGAVVDFSVAGRQSIQGMYSETVGGTVHTGDVLTLTFHQNASGVSDIPVTWTVTAGQTATQAATSLLGALQANSSLNTHGFRFSAGGTAKSTDTSAVINIFGPSHGQFTGVTAESIANWTITPSVTGTGHTTTLTQSLTPTDITLTANGVVSNGTTMVVQYGAEGGGAEVVNLTHVHFTNLNTNPMRIVSWQGGVLSLQDCHYSGTPLMSLEGWDSIVGAPCISDSVTVTQGDVSADGTTITPGGGGTLITLDGHWTFDGAIGADSKVMLEGVWAAPGSGTSMRVQDGRLFVHNNAGNWYRWDGVYTQVSFDPTALTTDGTSISSPPSGSVTTVDGTWTFGTLSGSDYQILLNGKQAPFGSGVQIEVNHGHKIYVKNNAGQWFLWQSGWIPSTAP